MGKQEVAYRAILERIKRGQYVAGQRLVIDSLTRELGMSQVPIREAIRKLEAEGLILYLRNAGPTVALLSPEEWAQLTTVLALLEGYATALAAQEMTAADIDRLREINGSMRVALEEFDINGFAASNVTFHTTIYAMSRNQPLIDQIQSIRTKLDAIRETLLPSAPGRPKDSLREHEELIEAIEQRREFSEIESLARSHKLNLLAAVKKTMEKSDAAPRTTRN